MVLDYLVNPLPGDAQHLAYLRNTYQVELLRHSLILALTYDKNVVS